MILIIDNYDSFTYNLYQPIANLTDEVEVIRNDMISIDTIIQAKPTGIVLSPGPGKPEDAGVCIELIKQTFSFIPILGVCLGHQAIAKAFGGHVVRANEIVHGKITSVFHKNDKFFSDMPFPFEAARYHSLIVSKENFPKELEVIAENNNGTIMSIKHKNYPTYGVQFHPESILTPYGNHLIKNFIFQNCHVSEEERIKIC